MEEVVPYLNFSLEELKKVRYRFYSVSLFRFALHDVPSLLAISSLACSFSRSAWFSLYRKLLDD
jgi:hypothetical protein